LPPVPGAGVPVKLSAVANHRVASVSSIRLPGPVPSRVAVAPDADDAQFRANVILIFSLRPDLKRALKRTCPWPGAIATNSYFPVRTSPCRRG
jgi:hypothetical protein